MEWDRTNEKKKISLWPAYLTCKITRFGFGTASNAYVAMWHEEKVSRRFCLCVFNLYNSSITLGAIYEVHKCEGTNEMQAGTLCAKRCSFKQQMEPVLRLCRKCIGTYICQVRVATVSTGNLWEMRVKYIACRARAITLVAGEMFRWSLRLMDCF